MLLLSLVLLYYLIKSSMKKESVSFQFRPQNSALTCWACFNMHVTPVEVEAGAPPHMLIRLRALSTGMHNKLDLSSEAGEGFSLFCSVYSHTPPPYS